MTIDADTVGQVITTLAVVVQGLYARQKGKKARPLAEADRRLIERVAKCVDDFGVRLDSLELQTKAIKRQVELYMRANPIDDHHDDTGPP